MRLRLDPRQERRPRQPSWRGTCGGSSWEHQIDIAPVFGGAGALAGPVGIVVEVVRNLRGPETAQIAVVEIAFERRAQAGGTAHGIDLPAGREDQRAAQRNVRPRLLRRLLLQGKDVTILGCQKLVDLDGLAVDRSKMFHNSFLPSKYRRYSGLRAAISPYTRRQTSVQPRIQSQ